MTETERHTVLILGAGASVAYGLPTGTELVNAICREFPNYSVQVKWFHLSPEQASARAKNLCDALNGAGTRSIDGFLEFREDLRLDGAIAIALALLCRERPQTLSNANSANTDNWYREFIEWLSPSPDVKFPATRVSVITCNYDRSLEQYMYVALKNRFRDSTDQKIAQLMDEVPIIHVHGSFGRLPWQRGETKAVPYGWEDVIRYPELIWQAARSIMIAFDPLIEKSDDLQRARAVLATATHIIFLGFGYDERNIRRLFDPNPIVAGHVHVVGTAFGLNKLEVRDATNMLKRCVVESFVELRPLKNCEFVRQTACFR